MKTLQELLDNSKHVVAFTGAGISTESGIPDFRSVGGVYTSGKYAGHSPEEILSQQFFRKNKPVFFSYYKERIMSLHDKQPNRSHYALTRLESSGKLKRVVTQNIDNLHQKSETLNVSDLHGNISMYRCNSACGFTSGIPEFLKLLDENEIPTCPDCGGVVRPCTVLFDESLDDNTYLKAYYEIKAADLLIVIGSSLLVLPASGLINEREENCKLAILNNSSTPYDKYADYISNESCGDVLESIVSTTPT
jgi:NAD-dependent deacetylase